MAVLEEAAQFFTKSTEQERGKERRDRLGEEPDDEETMRRSSSRWPRCGMQLQAMMRLVGL